jgi:O-glycosyl hydrolase
MCLILASPAGAATVNATADVNLNTLYQQIEGFGGAICYDIQTMANYSNRQAVYDLLFKNLGLDILRIKNTYQINTNDVNATARIVEAGKLRNPALKTLLVPWSPKASLKSDGTLGGVNSTLKKDAADPNNSAPYYYVYNEYAKWWQNSLTGSGGYFSQWVYPDYISIQNEPDWGYQDQVCRFTPTESSTYAGYDKAFEAVHNKLDGNTSPMPKMLAPEGGNLTGTPSFIDALVNRGQINNIYGFSHHLYDQDFNNPDDAYQISRMQNFKTYYGDYYHKPSFMTEFGGDGTPDFAMAMDLAQHIYNCLVYEGMTSYVHWSLIRDGGYTTGGVINLPSGGSYIVRDLYWFLKHYAFFTDPGWFRAKATTASGDLRITAFRNITDVNTTIVILNKSATNDVNLTLSLTGFVSQATWLKNEMYRSTSTSSWASLGTFNPNQALTIPAQSITTIHLATFQTCAEVQSAGYWLTSDITGDCYVDYLDLKVIADNWLRQDCNESNDWCDWADLPWTAPDGKIDLFDFSTFAPLWMRCNNPEDPNCRSSW